MKKRIFSNPKFFLFLIFFLALILRLLGLINIRLEGDFAYHWNIIGDMIRGRNFLLLGPTTSVNPIIHLGPFYYYLLSIPYLLGGGNYKIAIIFFSILNSMSIFPLYYISKVWFSKRASLQIISLYSFSSYLIQVQNFPWNPFVIPTLVIFSLYLLVKIREKYVNYLPLLFFLLGLGFSFHATFLFIIPLFLIFIPYKRISRNIIIISSLLFFLPFFTWLYYEVINNFIQTKEILTIFSPNKEICDFSVWIRTHGNGERCFHQIRNTLFIFRSFSQSLFATQNLFFVITSFIITSCTLFKTKSSQKIFFLVWISVVFLLFLTYSRNVYLHFFLIIIPLPFFILVLFLERIERMKSHGIILSNIFFLITIGWNFINYINSLLVVRG
jgi:hypothetical protein